MRQFLSLTQVYMFVSMHRSFWYKPPPSLDFPCAFAQALVHSTKAVLLTPSSSAADAYHLHGGILKDLGRLQEAAQVIVLTYKGLFSLI